MVTSETEDGGKNFGERRLNVLFRKFAAYKVDIKEMKARLMAKKSAHQTLQSLDEIEKDAQKLQTIKNQYSFGDSQSAQRLAALFAHLLEDLERKISRFKSGIHP